MMPYRVEVTCLCQEQIKEINDYLSNVISNPIAADKFLEETYRLVESLEYFPRRYPVRPGSLKYGDYEMRQIHFTMNYTAYYTIDESEKLVTIAEVRYAKRDSTDL